MANKDPTGKSAPAGGFKTGGWYSGYQYWNGSFAPKAGVIHPDSNQQGAGQAVSKEVVQQTNPANVAYIGNLNQGQTPQSQQEPKSREEVTPFLNNYQDSLFKATQAPKTRVPTMDELKTKLSPTTSYPEPLKRVEELGKLRTQYGVSDLETQLNNLKAQEDQAIADLRVQTKTEEGKPVPLNVIQGRVTEEKRQAQEQLDFIGRQKSRVVDELNTKYNIINQMMTLEGSDYNDAVKRYESEFDNNFKMYDLVAGARKEARSNYEYDQQAARANLQIYANAATKGNIDYNSLGADQKLMISKLEVQSGLPVGFISNLKISPGDSIINLNNKTGEALMVDKSGGFKVVQTGMRPSPVSSNTSDTKTTRNNFNEASKQENFPDLINEFASTMSLEEIYKAYANTDRGRKYGNPKENPQEIKLLYKIAKGEITPEEARQELAGY